MFFVKKKNLQESLSVQMDLNRESDEGLILDNNKNNRKKTTDYLISPTTHLFPLSSQSGSHGVSIKMTLKYQIWNIKLVMN